MKIAKYPLPGGSGVVGGIGVGSAEDSNDKAISRSHSLK